MMNKSWRKGVVALAVSAALGMPVSVVLAADGSTGQIVGSVQQGGAAVSGATVSIKNLDTGASRDLTTDASGSYRFPQLPTGNYEVVVTRDGKVVAKQNVTVGVGGSVALPFDLAAADRAGAEVIEVVGARPSAVDLTVTDSGLIIGEAEIDKLPVGRDTTSVALLAPGTVKGDSRFGNLASFSGASVAENVFYINGINVTNFRNGLGGNSVPFEFYKQFQVKTGGYGAEFGRSLGGVINAVTKTGTNEFEAGVNVYWTPDSLRENSPDTLDYRSQMYNLNSHYEADTKNVNIWAGGAIIPDHLFYYIVLNPRSAEDEGSGGDGSAYFERSSDDGFWGAKVDWQISDNHRLEVTAFSDSNETTTDNFQYDWHTGHVGDFVNSTYQQTGGDVMGLRYVGYLTDDLTLSVAHSKVAYDLTTRSSKDIYPRVADVRPGAPRLDIGLNTAGAVSVNDDERVATRIDFDWAIHEAHTLRFGLDTEELNSFANQYPTGGSDLYPLGNGVYVYRRLAAGGRISAINFVNPSATQPMDYMTRRSRTVGGSFTTTGEAFYIEDQWQVTDRIYAVLGMRNENFDNENALGQSFAKITNQWAPRLSATWDIDGTGESKAFMSLGRYHLPVANNTNVRLSGAEFDYTDYYTFTGINPANGAPIGATAIGRVTTSNGKVYDSAQLVDPNLRPMYQDELILGYQYAINQDWNFTIRGVKREVGEWIDDVCSDTLGGHCALTNPGHDVSLGWDTDGDVSTTEEIRHFTKEEVGLDKAEREYEAIVLELAGRTGDVSVNFNYTWSRNFGNVEGYVKSDIAQTDAGITQDFDFPELMDGAYGYLPNDRRHQFKLNSAWQVNDNWIVSGNFRLESGRPLNAFGRSHPNFEGEGVPYGDTFYTYNPDTDTYTMVGRGRYGRTPWIATLDMGVRYTTDVSIGQLSFYADVFNILDAQGVVRVNELAETEQGSPNSDFMLPNAYQPGRSVRLGAEFKF